MPGLGTNASAYTGGLTGIGMPGYLCQADLLNMISGGMSARSDTFTIRVMGQGPDGAKAYCEAIMQRTPGYVDTSNQPHDFALTETA